MPPGDIQKFREPDFFASEDPELAKTGLFPPRRTRGSKNRTFRSRTFQDPDFFPLSRSRSSRSRTFLETPKLLKTGLVPLRRLRSSESRTFLPQNTKSLQKPDFFPLEEPEVPKTGPLDPELSKSRTFFSLVDPEFPAAGRFSLGRPQNF